MEEQNFIEQRSVFSKRERLDLKAREHILVEDAKRTGDGAALFKFWAEKKEMFLNRAMV